MPRLPKSFRLSQLSAPATPRKLFATFEPRGLLTENCPFGLLFLAPNFAIKFTQVILSVS